MIKPTLLPTARKVSELTRINERMIWTLIGIGEMRSVRICRRRLILRHAEDTFIWARLDESAAYGVEAV